MNENGACSYLTGDLAVAGNYIRKSQISNPLSDRLRAYIESWFSRNGFEISLRRLPVLEVADLV